MGLADRCAIVGIGNTAYTRGTERSTLELHLEASLKALEDAGLSTDDVDGVMPAATMSATLVVIGRVSTLMYETFRQSRDSRRAKAGGTGACGISCRMIGIPTLASIVR